MSAQPYDMGNTGAGAGDEEAPVLDQSLFAPFPYPGNKRKAAARIWAALGDVPNYISPFCGATGDLFGRPSWHRPKIETINDMSAHVVNVMRSIKLSPEVTAEHADWWVCEVDLAARHAELIRRADETFVAALRADPRFHDPEMAGWWIWGIALWIGVGWCSPTANRSGQQKLPHLAGPANPIRGQLPHLAGCDGSGVGYGRGVHSSEIRDDLPGFFKRLAARLRRVRCVTGDFARVLTDAVTTSHGLTGVFLDPSYKGHSDAYEQDDPTASPRAREWALAHGDDPRFRIVLAGYEGEHDMPVTWRVVAWKSSGGSANAVRERLWLSPHCQGGSKDLPLWNRSPSIE